MARYGHSMVILRSNMIAIFGGTCGQKAFNDLYLLHIDNMTRNSITLRWSFVNIMQPPFSTQPVPCERSMQCMWAIEDSIYIFGGSCEGRGGRNRTRDRNQIRRMKEVVTDIFKMNFETVKSNLAHHMGWEQLSLYIYEANGEPPVIIDSSTLHTDIKGSNTRK